MPNKCVVGGCSNKPNLHEGIALHAIPFYDDPRPAAKKRRKAWVSFVKTKRGKWEPTKNSCICSKHFKIEAFENRFTTLSTLGKPLVPRLRRDSLGVSVVPTIHPGQVDSPNKEQSDRSRRKVSIF